VISLPPLCGLDELLRTLELEPSATGFRARNLDIEYHRVFGGQIIAQLITAAAATTPTKTVKSISVVFCREGATGTPMDYAVERLHDGRTFGTSRITASQNDKVIATALVSMHVAEAGFERNDAPPNVGQPEEATPVDLMLVPWEVRAVDGVDLTSASTGPPVFEMWMRATHLGDAPHLHQALLAHATDLTLIGTALRPFDGVSQADTGITLHTAVTSHSLSFHRPFRLDEWVLLVQRSPIASGGRAFGRGDVFDGDGRLVASYSQESMIRGIDQLKES